MQNNVMTVDGPSGVGKGTLSCFLSDYLGWDLLDSGAIYRLAAYYVDQNDLDVNNPVDVKKLEKLPISFDRKHGKVVCLLNGSDVTDDIRTEKNGMQASRIAANSQVRAALLACQKSFDAGQGLVADGRDMGTVVFPHAFVKFFLTASADARAKRRYDELVAKGIEADYEEVLQNIKKRDDQDKNRKSSPLIAADDAVIIDTSSLTIEQVQSVATDKIKNLKKG